MLRLCLDAIPIMPKGHQVHRQCMSEQLIPKGNYSYARPSATQTRH